VPRAPGGRTDNGRSPGPLISLANYWPVAVQLLGVALMAFGFGLLAVWAGLFVGGLGLVGFGLAAEVGRH